MSKRYYLCDIVGDGTGELGYYPAVDDHVTNWVAVFPPQDPSVPVPATPAERHFGKTSCLVLVSSVRHADVIADSRVDAMPDFPLDGRLNAMRSETQQSANTAATGRGFSVDWQASDGYRDMIRSLGRQLQPTFDENNFDVS